jgi:hypothetical protein
MTPEEIYRAIYSDAKWLQDRIFRLFPEIEKQIKRSKQFPFIAAKIINSPTTKIAYNIVFFAYQKSDWDKRHFIIYTTYTHEGGKTLVYVDNKKFAIRIYTPHFMQRYKERHADYVNENSHIAKYGIEVFFILRNWEVVEMTRIKTIIQETMDTDPELARTLEYRMTKSKFEQDPNYERYSVACMHGMCLCERSKDKNIDISIYNTFVATKQLIEEQFIDFIYAYGEVVLTTICRMYSRQRDMIAKEWNTELNNIPEGKTQYECMVEKINELCLRYPIPAYF